MPVEVVLALLRIEFDRAGEAGRVTGFECGNHRRVRQLRVKTGRLPPELGRRVGIRIGDHGVAVQCRQPTVHRRIRRQPRFHGKDVGQQILEALFQAVESGAGSEHGEMGGPDMCRNEQHLGTGLEADVEQIPAVESEDGTAVRLQVADGAEAAIELVDGREGRQADHIMHLPGAPVLLVDGADLDAQQETDLPAAGGRNALLDGVEQLRI